MAETENEHEQNYSNREDSHKAGTEIEKKFSFRRQL